MTTDVAERTEVKTETEESQAVETEEKATGRLTDNQQQETQTDTGTERETTEGQVAPTDTRQTRITALADAERAEAEERGRSSVLSELEQGQTQQQREATKQRLRQAFPVAQQKIDQVFAKAKDEYGSPRPLTDYEQTEVKNALAGYNLVADQVIRGDVASEVAETAYSILPKAAQETLDKLTTQDMPLPDYLNAWVETAALHTKAVKSMGVEEAMKVSAKFKREILARDVEQFDAGREQGRSDPAGTSPPGMSNGRTAPGSMSFVQLEEKYGRGETTAAETAEYNRLKAEKSKSGR